MVSFISFLKSCNGLFFCYTKLFPGMDAINPASSYPSVFSVKSDFLKRVSCHSVFHGVFHGVAFLTGNPFGHITSNAWPVQNADLFMCAVLFVKIFLACLLDSGKKHFCRNGFSWQKEFLFVIMVLPLTGPNPFAFLYCVTVAIGRGVSFHKFSNKKNPVTVDRGSNVPLMHKKFYRGLP